MFNKIVIGQRTGNLVVERDLEFGRAGPVNRLLLLLLRAREANLPAVLSEKRLDGFGARLINGVDDWQLESPATLGCQSQPHNNP